MRGCRGGWQATCAVLTALSLVGAAQAAEPTAAAVRVEAGKVLREMDPRLLGSTNVALWNGRDCLTSPVVNQWLREMGPKLIRLPGGSYADHVYWNGHGVRGADGKVDPTRMQDGYPAVNYADGVYEDSFTAARITHTPGESRAQNVTVRDMHEFVKSISGATPLIIANAGTGRAVDAAEWVRWANLKMGYNARYVEVGNELDGDWEPGHIMPNGEHMTGEIYANRFREFAKAIKAVDPTVKVGGAAGGTGEGSFNCDMLRLAGDEVDFVSIHNYYGTRSDTIAEAFDKLVTTTRHEVGLAKQWIRQFQPQRAEQIEIIYTEWNLANQPGDFCSDMYAALWSSWFLALAAENGVHAANQWDLFTHADGSGFAMIHRDQGQFVRKSQYYALQLWNTYTGGRLVASDLSGNPRVKTVASRSDDEVYVMLLNTDRDAEAEVTLQVSGFDPAEVGQHALLTHRQYFWPPNGKKPMWSEGIQVEPVRTANPFAVKLAPFSVNYLRIPERGSASARDLAATPPVQPRSAAAAQLAFIIPDETYAGDVLEGVLIATESGTGKPYPRPLPSARLSADAPVVFDRPAARLAEAVGHFSVKAEAAGDMTITAVSGDSTARARIRVKQSVPRPTVYWDFRDPIATDERVFGSDWTLVHDEGVRANKGVARVDFPAAGSLPSGTTSPRAALIVKKLPSRDTLNRANVRGAIFDVMLSPDFQTDDPKASLQVVMQSPLHGYWMPLGSVPFANLQDGKWHTQSIQVDDEKRIKAMEGIYNLWFVVSSKGPVKGSLYVDQIGLIAR